MDFDAWVEITGFFRVMRPMRVSVAVMSGTLQESSIGV
jgi:hypothetical protein